LFFSVRVGSGHFIKRLFLMIKLMRSTRCRDGVAGGEVQYNTTMIKQRDTAACYVQPYRYSSPNIPLSAIRRFARQIAERFHPDKIILFGSYAYGRPHNESDVDLVVIMPAYDVINQSIRICNAFDVWPFSLDLIVRTPKQIERGLREDDCNWFLREVMEKGKVLYEAPHRPVGS